MNAELLEVGETQLPRWQKLTKWYDEGTSESKFHTVSKPFYRQYYHETTDLVKLHRGPFRVACSCNIWQPWVAPFEGLSRGEYLFRIAGSVLILQRWFSKGASASTVGETFGIDFQCVQSVLVVTLSEHLHDLILKTTSLPSVQPSNLCCLKYAMHLQIILVLPATNSTSERSFSVLRRVKIYLRSTMTRQRLTNLMVLHVHKDITVSMNPRDVASEFVGY